MTVAGLVLCFIGFLVITTVLGVVVAVLEMIETAKSARELQGRIERYNKSARELQGRIERYNANH